MTGFEKRIQQLNIRHHRRMMQFDAEMKAKNIDEAYRHLSAACRLSRKKFAAYEKARLRGEDV